MSGGLAKGVQPKNRLTKAGPGRPKGSQNKTTVLVKTLVSEAQTRAGGVDYLVRQAEENPVAFMSLVGKLIPVQVGGDPDGAAIITEIRRTIVDVASNPDS